jgi:hypothetical protein
MDSRVRHARVALIGVIAIGLGACGDEETETETAQATSPNRAPIINGTLSAVAYEGEAYEFVPTASDPDGDPIAFGIHAKPGWADFDTATGRLSGTPGSSDRGMHRGIVIVVSDGEAETPLPTADIEVMPVPVSNTPPQISGNPVSSVIAGDFYDFVPVASDADGDVLGFSIQNMPGWAQFDPQIGRLFGTPGDAAIGTYGNIVISVSDGIATRSLGSFLIVVNPPPGQNTPPQIGGTPPDSVTVGEAYSFTPTASDANGDSLNFSAINLPEWAQLNPATGTLSGAPGGGDVGTYTGISIVVGDGQAQAALPSFGIEVFSSNSAPTISGTPPASVQAGSNYVFVPAANDPDGDNLSFGVTGLPSWANFSSTSGALVGTPGIGQVGAYNGISITVSDGDEDATLGPFSIQVTAPNGAPTIGGLPPASVVVGDLYSFVPTANDAENDPLTFSISGRPLWLNFSQTTGALTGTPGFGQVGIHNNISITVSDGTASATLGPFAISVVAPNAPPTISGTPPGTVFVGASYSFVPTAGDADGDTLSFSVSGLPSWASFNPVSGAVTGTPDAGDTGVFDDISITVTDGAANSSLGPFSIEVVEPNGAPVISGTPAGSVLVGESYSFVPTANDAEGDPLSFSISGQPSWSTFSSTTGALTGTPGVGQVGFHNGISITVSDGDNDATLGPFSIEVVAPNAPPTISGVPADSVLVGQSFSFVPTANDANGDTLSFSVSSLPSWASFDPEDGAVTGTPDAGDVGNYGNISITVTDGTADATLGPFSIEVLAVSLGSATLTWSPPTQNTDGSPLTDLAGFVVYWGTASRNYSNSVTLPNPGLTSYMVENLAPGATYYFATTSYNDDGLESGYSNEGSKPIP